VNVTHTQPRKNKNPSRKKKKRENLNILFFLKDQWKKISKCDHNPYAHDKKGKNL